jgi:SH3-like domain-containing protein
VTISSDNIPIAYRFESLSINNVEIKGDDNQQKQVNFTFTKNGNFILPSK